VLPIIKALIKQVSNAEVTFVSIDYGNRLVKNIIVVESRFSYKSTKISTSDFCKKTIEGSADLKLIYFLTDIGSNQ